MALTIGIPYVRALDQIVTAIQSGANTKARPETEALSSSNAQHSTARRIVVVAELLPFPPSLTDWKLSQYPPCVGLLVTPREYNTMVGEKNLLRLLLRGLLHADQQRSKMHQHQHQHQLLEASHNARTLTDTQPTPTQYLPTAPAH